MNTASVRLFIRVAFIMIVFLIGLVSLSLSPAKGQKPESFSFVQVSDTHIGFTDPKINPDHEGTLARIIASINNLSPQPDFVVFTGDLTHTTDEAVERRARLKRFAALAAQLKVKNIKYLPGEHDAALDSGEAFKELFGPTYYSFAHKGINFIVIDNVSDPTSSVGAAQLTWLAEQTKKLPMNARVVILTHRPLFDLYPLWDWWTRDAAAVRAAFKQFPHVLALYGHIHQFNLTTVGNIEFISARGAMYPLPAPGSLPKKAPVAWDAAAPYRGLGFRRIEVKTDPPQYVLTEYSVFGTPETTAAPMIKAQNKGG